MGHRGAAGALYAPQVIGRCTYPIHQVALMPDIPLTTVVVLCLAALAPGWIDAVVGGGGLLLLPALLLGTNKAEAVVGTSGAAVTYASKAPVDVRGDPHRRRAGHVRLAGRGRVVLLTVVFALVAKMAWEQWVA